MTTQFPLTAYRIFLSNGTNYVTNMAGGVTLPMARKYFVGTWLEQADEKTMLQVINVEAFTEVK